MRAHTRATWSNLVGLYRPTPRPATKPASTVPNPARANSAEAQTTATAVHLTGASMRLLEVGLAAAAIATALLAGAGR